MSDEDTTEATTADEDKRKRLRPGQEYAQLGDIEVTLQRPGSTAQRWELFSIVADTPFKAKGAALGMCLYAPRSLRIRTTLNAHKHNVAEYGKAVIDELIGKGHPIAAIMQAGSVAFNLCTADLISEQEVASQADFSGPEAG